MNQARSNLMGGDSFTQSRKGAKKNAKAAIY